MADVRFKLTIPPDAQLVAAVGLVAERVAQCAGYTAADARDIASIVRQAVERAVAQPAPAGSTTDALDLWFERNATHLDVWLCYPTDGCDRPAADPILSAASHNQEAATIEVGRDGERSYWRLRRALPRERVDHQCELPPDGH